MPPNRPSRQSDAEQVEGIKEQHEREDDADDLKGRPLDELPDQEVNQPEDEGDDQEIDQGGNHAWESGADGSPRVFKFLNLGAESLRCGFHA